MIDLLSGFMLGAIGCDMISDSTIQRVDTSTCTYRYQIPKCPSWMDEEEFRKDEHKRIAPFLKARLPTPPRPPDKPPNLNSTK